MAKRFTDTEKWKDDWYISLSNDNKVVWQWLIDNCSIAGVCKPSIGLLNMMCQVKYTEDQLIQEMDGRVISHGRIWFVPKFLKFQYSTLLSNKPAIVSVVKELFNYGLIDLIPKSFGNDYQIISESFQNHLIMIKDKDKDSNDLLSKTIKNEFVKFLTTNSVQKETMAMNNKLTIRDVDISCIGYVSSLIEGGQSANSLKPDFGTHFRNWFNKFGRHNISAVPKGKIEAEFKLYKLHEYANE